MQAIHWIALFVLIVCVLRGAIAGYYTRFATESIFSWVREAAWQEVGTSIFIGVIAAIVFTFT